MAANDDLKRKREGEQGGSEKKKLWGGRFSGEADPIMEVRTPLQSSHPIHLLSRRSSLSLFLSANLCSYQPIFVLISQFTVSFSSFSDECHCLQVFNCSLPFDKEMYRYGKRAQRITEEARRS